MKNIKVLLLAAAVLLSFSSCTKRDFTVETGNTPVEFTASTMDVVLNSNYNYIPIQMTAQGNLSSLATFELVEGTIVMKEDGSTVPVEDGVNVIFTSKEIYVGAYDADADGTDGLPSNNIEFSIPAYLDYQSVTLVLRLTGENLGSVTELTWTATAPTGATMAGNYAFGDEIITVVEDANGNFGIQTRIFGANATYSATKTEGENELTITIVGIGANVEGHGEVSAIMCGYHTDPNDPNNPNVYLWPNEPCVLEFSDDFSTVTSVNGIFHGFQSQTDGGWYNWFTISAGAVGTRQ